MQTRMGCLLFLLVGSESEAQQGRGTKWGKSCCSWTNTADLTPIRLTGKQINAFGSARVSVEGRRLPTASLKSWPACFYSATSDGGSSTAKHGEVIDTDVSEFLNPGGCRKQTLTLVVNPIRLVHRVSAGVGVLHEAGHSQCIDGLL